MCSIICVESLRLFSTCIESVKAPDQHLSGALAFLCNSYITKDISHLDHLFSLSIPDLPVVSTALLNWDVKLDIARSKWHAMLILTLSMYTSTLSRLGNSALRTKLSSVVFEETLANQLWEQNCHLLDSKKQDYVDTIVSACLWMLCYLCLCLFVHLKGCRLACHWPSDGCSAWFWTRHSSLTLW